MRVAIDVLPARVLTGLGVYTRRVVAALLRQDPTTEWLLLGDAASLSIMPKGPRVNHLDLAGPNPLGTARLPTIEQRQVWRSSMGRRLQEIQPDVHFGPAFYLPLGAQCFPMVATVHDVTFQTRPQDFSDEIRRYYRDVTADTCARASAVVCDSLHTKAELLRHFPVDEARTHVVHPCIEPAFQAASEGSIQRVRYAYGLPERFFLHVPGSWIARKNTWRLLDAYDLAVQQLGPDCPTLVIASPAALAAPVLRARIPATVRLLGYIPDGDFPAVISAAAALVYPSLEEGFGLPIAEALACGVNVVTSDRDVFREVAGACAIYVDPERDRSIAAGLCQAATETDDPNLVLVRQTQAAKFGPWGTASRLLAILRRCAGESGTNRSTSS